VSLCRELGFAVRPHADGPYLMQATLDLHNSR
jgi:hypothetical protein